MSRNAKPNLFNYATKELSQDAMICWLIKWADDRYVDADRALNSCGRKFVRALLREHGAMSLPESIETKIYRQDKGIDVLARVSPDHVLLIEDKTGTKDHSGQLKRYYKRVIEGRSRLGAVSEQNLYPIYLKTGNQSQRKDRRIEEATEGFYRPYRVFNRIEFLDVLRSYKGDHQALIDYRDYLERWEVSTNAFRDWINDEQPNWSWKSWEGFYRYLEDELDTGKWSYVANRSGGFLGFSWKYIQVEEDDWPKIYLQLEADLKNKRHVLCFKVGSGSKENARQRELKWYWHKLIREAGDGLVVRPRVMRGGWTMTVGHWEGDWLAFANGKINLAGTVANLRTAEDILRRAAKLGSCP